MKEKLDYIIKFVNSIIFILMPCYGNKQKGFDILRK